MVAVAFIIPLRGPDACNDWSLVSRLCMRTLGSITNQTSDDWRCILVCNQRPEAFQADDRITVIEQSFPTPGSRIECMQDKRRKKNRGLAELSPGEATYVMSFDADDLMHRRFVQSISGYSNDTGWLITNGYDYGGNWCARRKDGSFHKGCGSCSLLPLADIIEDPTAWRMPHTDVEEYYHSLGRTLRPVPGYPVVHVLETGENYMYMKRAINITGVRSALRTLRRIRPVTERFRRDFNLYPV